MSDVSFGERQDGYDYSYKPDFIPKYCQDCGISVQWYSVPRNEWWKRFDTKTGKKYLYEICLCPTDRKIQEAYKAKIRNSSLLERWWMGVTGNPPSFHVGYYSLEAYYRRYLQNNLEVIEEEQHGT